MPFSHDKFIKNYNKLAKLLKIRELNSDGVCYGLVMLRLKYKKENNLDEFYTYQNFISDLTDDQIRLIYKSRRNVEHKNEFSKILDFCENIQSGFLSQRNQKFKSVLMNWENSIYLHNSNLGDNLKKLLFRNENMFFIASSDHAMDIETESSDLTFYDPNDTETAVPEPVETIVTKLLHGNLLGIALNAGFIEVNSLTYGDYHSSIDMVIKAINSGNIAQEDNWRKIVQPIFDLYQKGETPRSSLISAVLEWVSIKENKILSPSEAAEYLMSFDTVRSLKYDENDDLRHIRTELQSIFEEHIKYLEDFKNRLFTYIKFSDSKDKDKINKKANGIITLIVNSNDIGLVKFIFSLKDSTNKSIFNPGQLQEGGIKDSYNYLNSATSIEMVKFFLEKGQSLYISKNGSTPIPLISIARAGRTEILLHFLKEFKNKNYLDDTLITLAEYGHLETLRKIFEELDVSKISDSTFAKMVDKSVSNNHVPVLQFMIDIVGESRFSRSINDYGNVSGSSILDRHFLDANKGTAQFLLDSNFNFNNEEIRLWPDGYFHLLKECISSNAVEKIELLVNKLVLTERNLENYKNMLNFAIKQKAWGAVAAILQKFDSSESINFALIKKYRSDICRSVLNQFNKNITPLTSDEELEKIKASIVRILDNNNVLGLLFADKPNAFIFQFTSKKDLSSENRVTKEIHDLQNLVIKIDDLIKVQPALMPKR